MEAREHVLPLGSLEERSLPCTGFSHLSHWFSSCPNWNTIDPEVRERLTRRHEDGEFW